MKAHIGNMSVIDAVRFGTAGTNPQRTATARNANRRTGTSHVSDDKGRNK